MNNKGFTLIELIATILILALIMSISTYSIVAVIRDSKEKNYEVLVNNVKSAVENYRIECKYGSAGSSVVCKNTITLGELVTYGYLSGNSKTANNEYSLVNPVDNKGIGNCKISYTYDNDNGIVVTAVNPTGSCPKNY